MTEGTAPPPQPPPCPAPPPPPPDMTHPRFSFDINEWLPSPVLYGRTPDEKEDIYRRRANDALFRQNATPEAWHRYVTLGYYAVDDGQIFEQEWNRSTENPVRIHQLIWYNYLYHIDRDMDIPPKLDSWATQISQQALQQWDPNSLMMDTLRLTWKQTMEKFDSEKKTAEWIPVSGRTNRANRRSPSPTSTSPASTPTRAQVSPSRMLQHLNLDHNTVPTSKTQETPRISHNPRDKPVNNISDTPTDPTPVPPEDHRMEEASDSGQSDKMVEFPVNDGTHRITIRWTVDGDVKQLEGTPHLLYSEIHSLLGLLFDTHDGLLHPWKNTAEYIAQPVLQVPTDDLMHFITPNITTIAKSSQIIFAIRFGFTPKHPRAWRNKETTKETMMLNKVKIQVSNSTSNCGDSVTAGYILLKHPKMTHKTWYLEFLRQQVPKETPYFDLQLQHKTPVGQSISHIAVLCGVNQVAPVCQALLSVLNGDQTSIFLPRYAFASMTQEKIAATFEAHQQYVKSLIQLPLFPAVAHLDRIRTEHCSDGTIITRSTREWALQLKAKDGETHAQCDVVNGGRDRNAYLLIPAVYAEDIKIEWRKYKERVFPMKHREAIYRERIPGLPKEIYIPPTLQSTLDNLDRLSHSNIWKNMSPSVKEAPTHPSTRQDNHRNIRKEKSRTNAWPSLVKRTPSTQPTQHPTPAPDVIQRTPQNAEVFTVDSDSNGNSQSIQKPPARASLRPMEDVSRQHQSSRMDDLERLLRSQQKEWQTTNEVANTTAQQLTEIQSRMAQMDKLQENVTLTMEGQARLTITVTGLTEQIQRLTQVIDRMSQTPPLDPAHTLCHKAPT